MKKWICFVLFIFVNGFLMAKDVVVHVKWKLNVSCSLSCSDFNFGTLENDGGEGTFYIKSDGSVSSLDGGSGSLVGSIPTRCNVACPVNLTNVSLKITDVINEGYVYGSADSENFLKLNVGVSESNGVCNIAGDDSARVRAIEGLLCDGIEYCKMVEGCHWDEEWEEEDCDEWDSAFYGSNTLCGVLQYKGSIPLGDYSTTVSVTLIYG